MSSTPFDPSSQPEYLSSHAPQEPPRSGRKKVVALAAVGVVVAGAVGAGAWAVTQLVGGGPGAASVLPDTALVYSAVDLDPSASQKIEAIQTIRKFPALAEELDLGSRDDLRRWVFDLVVEDGECEGLDYGRDIAPWIGDKLGVALVPGEKHPDPVIALQVTDEGKAREGIGAFFEACVPDEGFGITFLDGYALISQNEEIAEAAKTAAEKAPLADDAGYTAALDELGSLGIATVYVSPEGPAALSDNLMAQMAGGARTPDFCTETPSGLSPEQLQEIDEMCEGLLPSDEAEQKLDEALADFQGGAATLRFEDGGVELAAAGTGLPVMGADVTSVGDLPATTVAALGFSLSEGWTKTVEAQLEATFGPMFFQQMMTEIEGDTGLQLPEDIEKAFGTDTVLALDGSTDFEAAAESGDPTEVKAGIRVAGDEADVRRVITALVGAAGGTNPDFLQVQADGGRVAVSFAEDYVSQLLGGGDLGDSDVFQGAVAEADKARVALFVDFDAADGWLERLVAATGGSDDDVANAKPLSAFGLSGWLDGETSHVVVRLSTD